MSVLVHNAILRNPFSVSISFKLKMLATISNISIFSFFLVEQVDTSDGTRISLRALSYEGRTFRSHEDLKRLDHEDRTILNHKGRAFWSHECLKRLDH